MPLKYVILTSKLETIYVKDIIPSRGGLSCDGMGVAVYSNFLELVMVQVRVTLQ